MPPELGGLPPDSVQRALDEVFARPAYGWVNRPSLGEWLRDAWFALRDWLASFERTSPALFNVFLGALILLLVALLVHIGYVLWQILRRYDAPAEPALHPAASRALPAAAHLARADELARAGAWAEALGHRFLALILELDHRRALRFHPAKTPAEYVGEAQLEAAGRESLADLVARLYRHVFGAAPCDLATYRAFGDAAQTVLRSVRAH